MSVHTNHQIIKKDGIPIFALIPFNEYKKIFSKEADSNVTFPFEVAKAYQINGESLLKAWRKYRGYTQKEIANRLNISQSAYSQMEKSTKLQQKTLNKLVKILKISPEQLIMD